MDKFIGFDMDHKRTVPSYASRVVPGEPSHPPAAGLSLYLSMRRRSRIDATIRHGASRIEGSDGANWYTDGGFRSDALPIAITTETGIQCLQQRPRIRITWPDPAFSICSLHLLSANLTDPTADYPRKPPARFRPSRSISPCDKDLEWAQHLLGATSRVESGKDSKYASDESCTGVGSRDGQAARRGQRILRML